jgi:hypothetical protein
MAWYRNAALALAVLAAPPLAGQPPAGRAPETLQPDADEYLQDPAAVVVLTELRRQGDLGGKLFGMAGGDPAMNGLYTYLAFFISAGDGWRIFRIGDFLDYRIVSEAPGRVLLEIEESTMNEDGVIGTRRRRLDLRWTPGAEGAPPETVRMTPVR